MRNINKNKKSSNRGIMSLYQAPLREKQWGGDGTLICPDSVRVKLPFTQTLTPGTASGGLYVYQYRGNSAFDPDYTGVGLQPNGYDQWSQFYNEYVVLGSEITVEFIAAGAYVSELVVVPAFNSGSPANTKEAAGWRYAKTFTNLTGSNAAYKKVTCGMSTAQMCGVPPESVVYDSEYSATTASSPGNNSTWYWDIFVQNVSNSTSLSDVLRVTLTFDIKFTSPSQQAFSATPPERRMRVVHQPSLAGATFTERPRLVDESCSCASCLQRVEGVASCKRQ